MPDSFLDEEWRVLASMLPEDWRQLARETGAIRRARGAARDPDTLLRLILLHVGGGLSLRQAVARAQAQGLATLSDVALLKRLRSSEEWLHALAQRLFEEAHHDSALPAASRDRRLIAVDGTHVSEPGSTGSDWRVHYAISLPDLRCAFFEVTDIHGGERLERFPVAAGDIVLADRGYCHGAGAWHVLDSGGDFVMRLHSTNLPLFEPLESKRTDLLPWLRTLPPPGDSRECTLELRDAERRRAVRVCAVRKSKESTEMSRRRILKRASKSQKSVRPQTLEYAEFVMVASSLERGAWSTDQILELYRGRWQIELQFKRLKSLLQLSHLPKSTDASAHAWIEGKLLTALLIQKVGDRARFFSPWGYELRRAAAQPLA